MILQLPAPPRRSWAERLRDRRWQEKATSIKQRAGWICEECRRHDDFSPLEIHHVYYLTGRDPWDYPDILLMCLCEKCHEKRQAVEQTIFIGVGSVLRDKCLPEMKEMAVYHLVSPL